MLRFTVEVYVRLLSSKGKMTVEEERVALDAVQRLNVDKEAENASLHFPTGIW